MYEQKAEKEPAAHHHCADFGAHPQAFAPVPHAGGVRVLKDDNTEVEIMENIDYGDTDLRSIIEGDKRYNRDEEESYGNYGFSKQEFEGEELVDVEEDAADESADEELDF